MDHNSSFCDPVFKAYVSLFEYIFTLKYYNNDFYSFIDVIQIPWNSSF
jgi:hypothetical protein